ncbi:MAG: glucose-6-phosphate isomerase [Ignavibacteria bacterium]|nr:glucose-6-phosphate isomerase [Ignavibacteria bacterium]
MNLSVKNLKLFKFNSGIAMNLMKLEKDEIAKRIFEKDSTVWKSEPEYDELIKNRLGWLYLPVRMKENCDEIISFADDIRKEGFEYAVVLGMGGSSMCPEVCRDTFGTREGYLKLFVLDSTDPETVISIENSVNISKTIFIVSSKSGGTTEVDSFFRYFYDKVKRINSENPGNHFTAITDPDTVLEKLAKEKNFRRVFINPPDIGGRYSALSYFGLVPAALTGIDIKKLLKNAESIMYNCTLEESGKNYGIIIGAVAGELAKNRKDKLTFIFPEKIKSFGYWVEQLIAESTGKEGKGILPVEGEKFGKPSEYGKDRLFVYFTLGKESKKDKDRRKKFTGEDFTLIEINLNDLYDLGGQFYLWEFATAVMGSILGINPFDEPNVKESKDNTGVVLKYFEEHNELPEQNYFAEEGELKITAPAILPGKKTKIKDYLKNFLNQKKNGDYTAIMAYTAKSESTEKMLQKIRELLKSGLKTATTLGYGPRFLHSTGQYHKGGGDNGLFIQIVSEDKSDAAVPGKPYTFSILKQAQATGDYESLKKHNRRIIRIATGNNTEKGLKELYGILKKVL